MAALVKPKDVYQGPASMKVALQVVCATQIRLSQIVFLLLSRMLMRLPRHVTSFDTLSPQQRRYMLERINAAHQTGHAPSGPAAGPVNAQSASPMTLVPRSSTPVQYRATQPLPHEINPSCPLHGHLVSPIPQRQGQQRTLTINQTGPSSSSTGYSMTVNITGHNNLINTDELIQVVGRQTRAWQTRNRKLSSRKASGQPSQNNLVVNVNGSGCVIGGAATTKQAMTGRKRTHDDSERSVSTDTIKQDERLLEHRPVRRQKREGA